jgi:hypothetical protein
MSESLHPPYVPGSLSQWRTLNRWLDINAQNGPLARTQTFITLPSFSQAVTWLGYSDIVATFNFEGPNAFSLKALSSIPVNPNYCLCIMWIDSNNVTHRYAIWNNVGEVIYAPYPLYTGQLIKKNFRFEIWSTNSTPAVQVLPISFYTSVLGNVDYRYGTDSILVNNDTEVTDFENLNTTISLPDINSNVSLIDGAGLVIDNITGFMVSWTSNTSTDEFDPTGDIQCETNAQIGSALVSGVQFHTDTFMTDGSGSPPGVVAFTIKIDYPFDTTANFYDNNTGLCFGFNHTFGKFTGLTTGISNMSPVGDVWYIIIIDTLLNKISIYDLVTGLLLDTFTGTATSLADANVVIGNLFASTTEIQRYYTNLTSSEMQNLVEYFFIKYSSPISLPLIFPANSVPQSN